jgi:hypothetical protein
MGLGPSPVIAIAGPAELQLQNLRHPLEGLHRPVDSGRADHGMLQPDLPADLLDAGMIRALDESAKHGEPLRRKAIALRPQRRHELLNAIVSGWHVTTSNS